MKRYSVSICSILLSAASMLTAQSSSSSLALISNLDSDGGSAVLPGKIAPKHASVNGAFTHIAFGGGISPMGVNLSVATNVNRYMNIRGVGNVFKYNVNNISTNGFNVDAKLNLASAGASLDFYPFPRHGFRVSPGVLMYNQNAANATFHVTGGTSFSLNDYTYYASSSNPVTGSGGVGLHSTKPAFTATTGWGNMIPRSGGHWSFPFELGAAFIGAPTFNMALTSGQVCDAQGQNCVDVASDPTIQTNLQEQVAKYRKDLDPLKTYPIVSFGVAYSFRTRSGR